MPSTSEAALARKAERKRQRDKENYAANKEGRKSTVKAQALMAKDVQHWTFGCGALGDGQGPRFDSRPQFRRFIKAIMYVAKQVKTAAVHEAQAEREERDDEDTDSEPESPSSDTTESSDDTESTMEEDVDMNVEAAKHAWLALHQDDGELWKEVEPRMHWDVTMLEGKCNSIS